MRLGDVFHDGQTFLLDAVPRSGTGVRLRRAYVTVDVAVPPSKNHYWTLQFGALALSGAFEARSTHNLAANGIRAGVTVLNPVPPVSYKTGELVALTVTPYGQPKFIEGLELALEYD